MAFTVVTVRGRFLKPIGDGSAELVPAKGRISFVLSVALQDPNTNEIVSPARISIPLDETGSFATEIVATDDPDVSPQGASYLVTESIRGAASRTYSIQISHTATDLDLADLVPVVPGPVTFAYALQSALSAETTARIAGDLTGGPFMVVRRVVRFDTPGAQTVEGVSIVTLAEGDIIIGSLCGVRVIAVEPGDIRPQLSLRGSDGGVVNTSDWLTAVGAIAAFSSNDWRAPAGGWDVRVNFCGDFAGTPPDPPLTALVVEVIIGYLPLAGGSGGSSGGIGSPIVRAFPFTFDTPDLLTGHAVYTPTVGDLLLDAWFEVDTAWNGTTPTGDIGTFVTRSWGLFDDFGLTSAIDMTTAGFTQDTGLFQGGSLSLAQLAAAYGVKDLLQTDAVAATPNPPSGLTPLGGQSITGLVKFLTADPIKVVVSQDGTNTGADPGSTQGAAVLYLVTATPWRLIR